MTLFPSVQLRVGDTPVTSIPPDKLVNFEYKNSTSSLATFQFTAVDPTFKDLEDQLLLADDNALPMFMRFGYFQGASLRSREWVRGYMINYVPKITLKGMEILANFVVMNDKGIVRVSSQQYAGRISSVVEKIAEYLDMVPEVEETNDDGNEASEDAGGGPRQWAVGTSPTIKFIRDTLLPNARSKSSKGSYDLFVTHETGDSKPVLHFHTVNYPGCSRRQGTELSLRYLAGQDDVITEFTPNFDSRMLGSYGVRSLVSDSFDPDTGQNRVTVDNTGVTDVETSLLERKRHRAKSLFPPLNESDPGDETESHGRIPDHGDAISVQARAVNRWDTLYAASRTAGMVLIGFPEFVNLEPLDYANIAVMLPHLGGWREHWSGGRWVLKEVLHQIGTSYMIQCQLQRMTLGS